jgi:hypothetical protein
MVFAQTADGCKYIMSAMILEGSSCTNKGHVRAFAIIVRF